MLLKPGPDGTHINPSGLESLESSPISKETERNGFEEISKRCSEPSLDRYLEVDDRVLNLIEMPSQHTIVY